MAPQHQQRCVQTGIQIDKKMHKPHKLTLGIHHDTTIVTSTESTVTLSKVDKVERGASFHAQFLSVFFLLLLFFI